MWQAVFYLMGIYKIFRNFLIFTKKKVKVNVKVNVELEMPLGIGL